MKNAENSGEDLVRSVQADIREQLRQMEIAEAIMKRYSNALRKLQLSDEELELHLAKIRS